MCTELRAAPNDGGERTHPRPEKSVQAKEPKHQEVKQRCHGAKHSG
jgi:hypothetical protein